MTIRSQKYLVAALSLALLAALGAVGSVDAKRRAELMKTRPPLTAGALNPQLERGKLVFAKYGCNACHGAGGVGGVKNINAQTGGEVNGLLRVSETYTREELVERIRNGVPTIDKGDPTGPEPPLHMPPYKDLVGGQEMQDLVSYLMSLRPQAGEAKSEAW
jgi:mono/diheme cytochrome c family protein